MRTIERNIVSALLETGDGRLFQAKKNKNDGGVYQDCWHIPGGGIEEGEDILTAIQREIKEETGLEISKDKFVLIDDLGKMYN